MKRIAEQPDGSPTATHGQRAADEMGQEVEPPTLAAAPASPWSDGFGRLALRSAQTLLVLAVAVLLVMVLVRLRLVVVPILIATLLAAALSPLVRVLHERGVPRLLATWAALLAAAGAIGFLGWIVVVRVRNESDELVMRASEGLVELERFLTSGPLPIDPNQLSQARTAVVDVLSGDQVRSGAVSGATAAAEVVAGFFLAGVILFFLLKDGAKIWEFLLRPLSGHRLRRMRRVGERSVGVLGGYVRGTAIVALVDAVIIGVALLILGVPLALPLALVVFLGAFIPLIGATLAGILAALVALVANGPVIALIVVAVVIAVNQIEGDVLAPIVLGRALSLHPLAILLALTAGTILAGIIGALLSVPLAAVAWTAITTWNEDKRSSPVADPLPRPATAEG